MNMIDSKRVLREIMILGKLGEEHHSHVVELADVIAPEPITAVYVVMECCDTDLKNVCRHPAGVSLPQARRLSYNLLVGCGYLHAKGVYHRDLKPANCLANKDCSVKICDFNLSRAAPRGGLPEPELQRTLTTHVITRWYRAPEVLLQMDYTEEIDVWSAGCIIAELMNALNTNGRVPRSRPIFQGSGSKNSRSEGPGDQLHEILKVLGSPLKEPEFKTLPPEAKWVLKMTVEDVQGFPVLGLKSTMNDQVEDEALDLLEKMVRFFPASRISMADAIQHTCFQHVRRSPDEQLTSEGHLTLDFDESQAQQVEDIRFQLGQEAAKYH